MLPGAKAESVFLAGLPRAHGRSGTPALVETLRAAVRGARARCRSMLEAARRDKLIGASLEARVVLQRRRRGCASSSCRTSPSCPRCSS